MDVRRAMTMAGAVGCGARVRVTASMGRRAWMQVAAGSVVALIGRGRADGAGPAVADPKAEAEAEWRKAEDRLRRATGHRTLSMKSAHYQAMGDASEGFIKLTVSDCEQMAADYIGHFRSRGFDVKLPARRLTLIVLRDERPFHRLVPHAPPGAMGLYSPPDNWLALFDFRNMPMFPYASGQSNMETLTHEATHQLCFNTGLLDRDADIPLSIVEGLAMYCERRRLTGGGEPGRPNLRRLEELAHFQRRVRWIRMAELLVDDRACFRRSGDRTILSYSESWVLVHHLMSDPDRLPQFRAYLDVLRKRNDPTRRLEDAKDHFGDLAKLDDEVRQQAIRLQRAL